MWANFFNQCFVILREQEVLNDSDIIREAIMNGTLQYEDGVFIAKKQFSNKVAQELERIGAKYSRGRRGYVIARENLSADVLWAIDTTKAKTAAKAAAINQYLLSQLSDIDKIVNKLVFDEAVKAIMSDLQERVYKNAEQHKIELITPKIDDFMSNEIAQRYTNNLNFWIKNWTEEEIIKMRNVVGQMAIDGKSTKTIAAYIEKEFGISQRHAKFLARNESAIATSSYLSAKYEAEGFTHFKWETIVDGRERDLHKKLNGTIWRFDNPPVIDDRTGEKGLPSQTYNCRCSFSPVINGEFLKRRREMFKAQNSLIDKIKQLWKKTA